MSSRRSEVILDTGYWILDMRLFCLLLLALTVTTQSQGKPFVFEGFVEIAPTNFVAPVTHVMRFDPAGKIDLALVETGRRLQSRPLERVKILGELASDRVTNGVPIIRVEEVGLAGWSSLQGDFSGGRVANWDGVGSSLYPGIIPEPLPEAGFATGTTSVPPFYLAELVYDPGTFRFRMIGTSGWQGIVDASTNLVSWSPIMTNTIIDGGVPISDPEAGSFPTRFYRARMLPPE